MELLAFKLGNKYIRLKQEKVEFTSLSKASVYPLENKKENLELYQSLKNRYNNISLVKLSINEENYDINKLF